ncbi:MAG TPA: DNA internalization-related competence protein ComEC/Rec2, partial [Candidatus Polarisedimenticolia bacterium]|nr:DNA internalization-related competence protein ComEC/Rec2 [Candidatus Polarisedimenticolia bacterium]
MAPARRVGVLLAALALGFSAGRAEQARDPRPALLAAWKARGIAIGTTPIAIEGTLLAADPLPDGRTALVLSMERYVVPGGPSIGRRLDTSVRARLTVPAGPEDSGPPWRVGDRLRLTARLAPPRNFRNPGSFDYAAYLKARDIDFIGTIKSARLIERLPGARRSFTGLCPALRGGIVARLRRASGPDGGATASFLAAILVGERDDLPPALEEALLKAGVYHIIALSGLNVGLMALLILSLGRLLPLGASGRRALVILGVAAYWAVARPSGSIDRAALMALLHFGGGLLQRRVPALGSLAIAAVLLLFRNSAWITDAGFQLSFAATLAIILWPAGAVDRPPARRTPMDRIRLGLAAPLRVSIAALAGTALVGAHHFQSLTPAALLANLVAVPIASLLLYLALAIVVLEPLLPVVAGFLATVAGGSIALLGRVCSLLAAVPGLSFHVVPPPAPLVLWSGAALLVACLARRITLRRAAGLQVVAAIIWSACAGRAPRAPHALAITALDVGQGDALLVEFPNGTTMLIDAGGFGRSSFDVGAKVVAPALRALGHLRIDILAITHAHRDHLGGAAAVLGQLHPGALWLGRMPPGDGAIEALERLAAERSIAVVRPRRGVHLGIGGSLVEVLNPGAGVSPSGAAVNDDSLVLRVVYGDQKALLTGDLEAPLESLLLREGRKVEAGLLKVGHHGSRTSTTAPFLARVGPRMAVVSVGAGNPWGHPDREVLDRLRAAGVTIGRTDRDGAIRFRTDGSAPWVSRRLVETERLQGEAETEDQERQTGDAEPGAPGSLGLVEAGGMRAPAPHEREEDPDDDQVVTAGDQPQDDENR